METRRYKDINQPVREYMQCAGREQDREREIRG